MTTKLARDLVEGDIIDLEGDRFATAPSPLCTSEQAREDHLATVDTFRYEYAEVEEIERETDTCVVVHTSLTSFACPPDHPVAMAPEIDLASRLSEQNARMRDLDLEED
jgi:hypothetical protein